MIVLATPKGWTGPKVVDGQQIEGTFRSHQVPLSRPRNAIPSISRCSKTWLRELPARGALRRRTAACVPELAELAPRAHGAWARIRTPTAACCCATCGCRISATTRCASPRRARVDAEDTRVLGAIPARRRSRLNDEQRNFRIFGPDETRVEPARRRVRSRPTGNGTRRSTPTTNCSRPTGASWRC